MVETPPGPARVLVVDDNEANRYAVARHLRGAGYEVIEAGTGTAGLDAAVTLPLDVIILDVRLPDVDGFEVARRLRAHPATAAVPILHISASFTDSESQVQGLEGGADGYLTHPVDPPVLLATVRALRRTRAAERRARDTARQWRATFDAIRDGVCVIGPEGRVLRCNRAFAELLDRSYPELLGQPVAGLIPALAPATEPPFVALPASGEGGSELRLNDRWLAVATLPVPDEAGKPVAGLMVLSDVTERRLAEDRVRQSQKLEAVGRLAGGVAHEINNMMTVVLGFSGFALKGTPPDDPRRGDLEQIQKAAERAAEISRQLLAFGRRQLLHPQVLELETVIRDMETMLRQLLGADRQITFRLAARPNHVRADRGQLEQVLVNLALNARDAMPEGGTLLVESEALTVSPGGQTGLELPAGTFAVLTVADSGHGMDAETLTRAFEPFFTTKRVGQGTGLGLSTVYGIVKQSDGYIGVSSEPGRGTTFRVFLPLVERESGHDDAPDEPDEHTARGETLLIVEDEPMVQSLARRVLEGSGYRVLTAGGGEAALELLSDSEVPVGLVLADVVMPGMSGRELADRLVASHPGLPVLYMSGYTNDEIIQRGLLDPGSRFIQKPFDPDSLLREVESLLAAGRGAPE